MADNRKFGFRDLKDLAKKGIDSIDELNRCLSDAQAGYQSASSALRETDAKLKSVNEAIHHLGVYLSRKKLYREFLHAKNKGVFRAAHKKEIDEYEGSSAFLKKQYGEGVFPSMKTLKAEKASLSKQRRYQKELLRQNREARNQMSIIRGNVQAILGQQSFMPQKQPIL